MKKHAVELLQADLMRIGYHLLVHAGVNIRKMDPNVVPTWARTHAEILARTRPALLRSGPDGSR